MPASRGHHRQPLSRSSIATGPPARRAPRRPASAMGHDPACGLQHSSAPVVCEPPSAPRRHLLPTGRSRQWHRSGARSPLRNCAALRSTRSSVRWPWADHAKQCRRRASAATPARPSAHHPTADPPRSLLQQRLQSRRSLRRRWALHWMPSRETARAVHTHPPLAGRSKSCTAAARCHTGLRATSCLVARCLRCFRYVRCVAQA